MTGQDEPLYNVAKRHYVDGATMEAIAQELGVSRPTVSRMLARARESGIVRITLAEPPGTDSPTARAIASAFGIEVHVVNVSSRMPVSTRLSTVARHAAQLMTAMVNDYSSVGVAWGVTAWHVARALEPMNVSGVRVVQVNGSMQPRGTGLPYVGALLQTFADALGHGTVIPFPVPAFFDQPATRELMWQERSVRSVLDQIRNLDVAVFGVGYPHAHVPSHVYTSGYIEPHDLTEALQAGAIGDVCTVLLRTDGSWEGLPMNDRSTGPTPEQLRSISRRLCVVGDHSRARALLAALRAGVVTDLVCDSHTARALHELLSRQWTHD